MVPYETLLAALLVRDRRYLEVMKSLEDPAVFSAPARITALQKERGLLQPFHGVIPVLEAAVKARAEAESLVRGDDPELVEMARGELPSLGAREEDLRRRAEDLLVADDGLSHRDVILEVRGGTGGEEAALFARDLYRMYSRYAERKGWKIEIYDTSLSERGGLKEIVCKVSGPFVYRSLRYESGGHRVQRVPQTETQGRIHTSLATVAVLPEAEEVEVSWKPDEVRVDTMRAGGPGGQKVNKTESAVRMTHLPTGIADHCQDEKSQHKNRARAESILRSRLAAFYREKLDRERAAFRKSQVGTGDRSEKVRTYNYAQNRVTDHRAEITLHALDRIIDGDLDPLFERLQSWDRENRLRSIQEEGPDRGSLPPGKPNG